MTAPLPPLLEAVAVSKSYGSVSALDRVSVQVRAGEVTCLLGDNGAGKSTLIKILCGAERPDAGRLMVEGSEVVFRSPVDALDRGIATVFQDLAVVPVMSIYRNFFMGREPVRRYGPISRFDQAYAKRTCQAELSRLGIDLADVSRPIATLSGGQRQSVAIARAVHFGARVLILDEPTSALGVREAGIVLDYVEEAKGRGVAVALITHNAHHAYRAGDRFVILSLGRVVGTFNKAELSPADLTEYMAGGDVATPIGR